MLFKALPVFGPLLPAISFYAQGVFSAPWTIELGHSSASVVVHTT